MPWLRSKCLLSTCLGILVLLGVGLVGVDSAAAQALVPVVGEVRTERDQVISSGVTVLVKGYDGRHITEKTANSQGKFELENLHKMPYRLTVSAEGFYPLYQDLNLSGAMGPVTVHFTLTAISRAKSAALVLPPLTDMNLPRKARKAFEKGLRALEANNLSEARNAFEKAIAEYPCYARAQTGLAAVFSAIHDFGSAQTALRKAIQCAPGFPDAYASLGQILNSERRFSESEALLQQGLHLCPRAWQLYEKLATAHYSMGQYAKAEREWLQVGSLNPAPPADLHAKLAAVYLQEGMNDKAYAEMQAYLQADLNGRFAAQIKTLMRRIESAGTQGSAQTDSTPPPPLEH
jgi:tetratricopeptide (TPR) repeat protein